MKRSVPYLFIVSLVLLGVAEFFRFNFGNAATLFEAAGAATFAFGAILLVSGIWQAVHEDGEQDTPEEVAAE